jgi:hypothetical protein
MLILEFLLSLHRAGPPLDELVSLFVVLFVVRINTIHTSCLPGDQGDENDVEREKNQLQVASRQHR